MSAPEQATPAETPPDEQPVGAELVAATDDRAEVFEILDRHDEAMIVEELQRRALKVMLYSFSMEGTQLTDLSYLGVNEAVRVMNQQGWRVTIDPESLVVESVVEDLGEGPVPCWQATVYAIDRRTNYGQFGTYTQPKRMKLRKNTAASRRNQGKAVADDDTIADQFARQKAINKAQRNALRIHIPEAIRQTLIAQYRNDPETIRHIQVGAGAAEIADLPAPLTTPEAVAKKNAARAIYQEIRELNPILIKPAQFHAFLLRAEHDLDRLDDFIGFLEGHLEAERAKQASA